MILEVVGTDQKVITTIHINNIVRVPCQGECLVIGDRQYRITAIVWFPYGEIYYPRIFVDEGVTL